MKDEQLRVTISLKVTDEDVDDIMVTALEGGITHWCYQAEPVGEYLGDYVSSQLAKGGSITLHTEDGKYVLTREDLLNGLARRIQESPKIIEDGGIDTGYIDADEADRIIQYAVFGKLVYG